MQREKQTYPIVKKYKSFFFWKECMFCHKEFKREDGYSIIDIKSCRASDESPLYYAYCCSKCANSTDEVKDKLYRRSPKFIFDILEKERKRRRILDK